MKAIDVLHDLRDRLMDNTDSGVLSIMTEDLYFSLRRDSSMGKENWDYGVRQITSWLNRWLIVHREKAGLSLGDIEIARRALGSVDRPEHIQDWINNINKRYVPTALEICRKL